MFKVQAISTLFLAAFAASASAQTEYFDGILDSKTGFSLPGTYGFTKSETALKVHSKNGLYGFKVNVKLDADVAQVKVACTQIAADLGLKYGRLSCFDKSTGKSEAVDAGNVWELSKQVSSSEREVYKRVHEISYDVSYAQGGKVVNIIDIAVTSYPEIYKQTYYEQGGGNYIESTYVPIMVGDLFISIPADVEREYPYVFLRVGDRSSITHTSLRFDNPAEIRLVCLDGLGNSIHEITQKKALGSTMEATIDVNVMDDKGVADNLTKCFTQGGKLGVDINGVVNFSAKHYFDLTVRMQKVGEV